MPGSVRELARINSLELSSDHLKVLRGAVGIGGGSWCAFDGVAFPQKNLEVLQDLPGLLWPKPPFFNFC